MWSQISPWLGLWLCDFHLAESPFFSLSRFWYMSYWLFSSSQNPWQYNFIRCIGVFLKESIKVLNSSLTRHNHHYHLYIFLLIVEILVFHRYIHSYISHIMCDYICLLLPFYLSHQKHFSLSSNSLVCWNLFKLFVNIWLELFLWLLKKTNSIFKISSPYIAFGNVHSIPIWMSFSFGRFITITLQYNINLDHKLSYCLHEITMQYLTLICWTIYKY